MSLFVIDTSGTSKVESGKSIDNELALDSDSESEISNKESKGLERIEQNLAVDEDDDDEFIILPPGSEGESDEDSTPITIIPKLMDLSCTITSNSKKKKDKDELDFDDAYLDMERTTVTKSLAEDRKSRMKKKLQEKSLAMKPGLEQLESVPKQNLSQHQLKKQKKAQKERMKGKEWFNFKSPEITDEVKRDLEVLQMRSVLDPKTFYKKNDLKVLPKYFQIGKVQDSAADFYHSRIPKKERKRTLVDELLADAEFQKKSKQKFKEIVAEKERSSAKAHRHAKRLKKRKT